MAKKFIFLFFVMMMEPSLVRANECRNETWQFSKLDIEATDVDYLKVVMGFSYGAEVTNFIPEVKLANSNMFYVESKTKPLITYFTTEFKSAETALKAVKHLNEKWAGNKNNQYEVFSNGNSVTWFGNNRLSPSCFNQIVAEEKKSLAKK